MCARRLFWFLLFWIDPIIFAGIDRDSVVLERDKLSFTLQPGQRQQILFTLQKGELLHVLIAQDHTDYLLEWERPDGRQLEINAPTYEEGFEEILILAREDGTHCVSIRIDEHYSTEPGLCTLEVSRRFADTEDEARARAWLAMVRAEHEDRRRADQLLNQSYLFWQQQNDVYRQSLALTLIGLDLEKSNQRKKAIATFQKALALLSSKGQHHYPLIVTSHNRLGRNYHTRGQHQKALSHFRKGLELAEQHDYPIWRYRFLRQIALVSYRRGHYETAIEFHAGSLNLALREAMPQLAARSHLSLAIAFISLGQLDRARDHIDPAYEIWRERKDYQKMADVLRQRAWIHALDTQYNDAMLYFDQALDFDQKSNSKRGEAATLDRMGTTLRFMGHHQEALIAYQHSLTYWQKEGLYPQVAEVLSNIGQAHAASGDWQNAVHFCKAALQVFEKIGKPGAAARACFILAQDRKAAGELEEALFYISRVLDYTEGTRKTLRIPTLGRSYTGTRYDYYRFAIDLLMDLHQTTSDASYAHKAFMLSEHNRARSLKESLLSSNHLSERQGMELQRLGKEITEIMQARDKARSENADHTIEKYDRALRQLMLEQDKLFSIQEQVPIQPFPIETIQRELLDKKTLLLSYVFTRKRSYLWAITRDRVNVYRLEDREAVEGGVQDLFGLLSKPPGRRTRGTIRLRAQTVADMLLRQITPVLEKYDRLAIITDSPLYYMPFSLLPSPLSTSGTRYLIQDHEIIYLPSASFGLHHRRALGRRKSCNQQLAVFADPHFDPHDLRFPRLPGTRQEAHSLLAMVAEDRRFIVSGLDASRDRVFSIDLSDYQFLHFATHFYRDPNDPALSAIVLSQVDSEGTLINGFLRAIDFATLNLNAECITLSACQSGSGEWFPGDGMWGMSPALLSRSGAASTRVLVSSLWPISDKGSIPLMTHFYRYMLTDGFMPSLALKKAQVELIQSQHWFDPYYWAAFVPHGDWLKNSDANNSDF